MNPVDQAKTISMVVLFAASLVLGLLPIWIVRRLKWKAGVNEMSSKTKNILSGLLCFGGGVLMATSLTHLLPELHDGVKELQESGVLHEKLPLAEIFFSAGFFLVYLVEEVVHLISDRHAHNKTDVSIHRSVGVRECVVSREGQPVPPCQPDNLEDGCHEETICQSNCEDREFCKQNEPSITTITGSDQFIIDEKSFESSKQHKMNGHHHDHHDHHHHFGDGDRVLPSVRGLLVIVGLSLHEILEGIAIGLEETEGNVWSLFAAVATHKFVIAFCVGIEMASNGVKTSLHIIYMLVLSLVTSIGIGIGMALSSSTSENLVLTSLVLQGFAAGTLIYVAFFEVLERERSKSSIKLLQWATLLLGFLAMIGLEALIPAHEHDHDHSHEELCPTTVASIITDSKLFQG